MFESFRVDRKIGDWVLVSYDKRFKAAFLECGVITAVLKSSVTIPVDKEVE